MDSWTLVVEGWTVALYRQEGGIAADIQLGQNLKLTNVEVYGVDHANPYQHLRIEKRNGKFCVLGHSLLGGGCGTSKKPNVMPAILHARRPTVLLESSQLKAENTAKRVESSVKASNFKSLPLGELQSILPVTVQAPLEVARSLLAALSHEALWAHNYTFQLRATLARMARTFLTKHIVTNSASFIESSAESCPLATDIEVIKGIIARTTHLDYGVQAELGIAIELVDHIRSKSVWWRILSIEQPCFLDYYFRGHATPTTNRINELVLAFKALASRDAVIERVFMTDRLYMLDSAEAFKSFVDLVSSTQCWEVIYMACSYFELGLHRSMFSNQQLKQLKPTLARLVEGDIPKLKEKLLAILLKLKELNLFQDLLGLLQKQSEWTLKYLPCLPSSYLHPWPEYLVLSNIPKADKLFVGRLAEVAAIKQALVDSRSARVAGLPGVGKTALCLKVASELEAVYDIIWHTRGASITSFEESLEPLATILQEEPRAADDFSLLKRGLKSFRSTLLIVDDLAPTVELSVKGFKDIGVDIISTHKSFNGDANVTLKGFSEGESLDLIKSSLEQASAAQIAGLYRIRGNALILRVAENFVLEDKASAELFGVSRMSLPADSADDKAVAQELVQSLLSHLFVTKSKDLLSTLYVCAILAIDQVRPETLESLISQLMPEVKVKQLLKTAKLYGFIEVDRDTEQISMHNLLRKSTIEHCYNPRENLCLELASVLSRELQAVEEVHRDLVKLSRSLFGFFHSKLRLHEVVGFCPFYLKRDLASGVNQEKTDNLRLVLDSYRSHGFLVARNANLVCELLECCMLSGLHDEAAELGGIIKIGAEDLPRELQAYIFYCLGRLYISDYSFAENCLMKSLAAYKYTVMSPLDVAKVSCSLGDVLSMQRKWAKAAMHYTSSMEFYQEFKGQNSPLVAEVCKKLGRVLRAMSDSKAEQTLMKGLMIEELVYPPNDLRLADTYCELGTYVINSDKAKAFLDMSLRIRQHKLDPSHPELAKSWEGLGEYYELSGNKSEAERCFIKSLELREQALSRTHSDLISSYIKLGTFYRVVQNFSASHATLMKAAERLETDQSNPQYADALSCLGVLHVDQEQPKKAEELYTKALELRKKYLEETDPGVASSHRQLGELYKKQRRFDQAEECFIRNLDFFQRNYDSSHPDCKEAQKVLNDFYAFKGKASLGGN